MSCESELSFICEYGEDLPEGKGSGYCLDFGKLFKVCHINENKCYLLLRQPFQRESLNNFFRTIAFSDPEDPWDGKLYKPTLI